MDETGQGSHGVSQALCPLGCSGARLVGTSENSQAGKLQGSGQFRPHPTPLHQKLGGEVSLEGGEPQCQRPLHVCARPSGVAS